MGNLNGQMEAMVEGILSATLERKSTVGDIKAATGRMLLAFNRERRTSVTRLRSELFANCQARAVNTRRMCQGFHRDQDRLAKNQRRELAKGCRTRSLAVVKLMDDFKMSRREMAQELTESLQKSAQVVQSQVSSLREDFRSSFENVREDVQSAHETWNDFLLTQAGVAAPMATPSGRFEMGVAEVGVEKASSAGDVIHRFVAKRGKSKKR